MKSLHEAGWLFYDDLIPVDNIIDNNVDHTQRIVRVRFSDSWSNDEAIMFLDSCF
jgi:hypothetical protein